MLINTFTAEYRGIERVKHVGLVNPLRDKHAVAVLKSSNIFFAAFTSFNILKKTLPSYCFRCVKQYAGSVPEPSFLLSITSLISESATHGLVALIYSYCTHS